ncbi:MAG: hypothetical protein GVY06_01855 [Alphaproteobacteria bacterium]|jgi:uncharacterized membrane protein|nr:hypothetical protein [Alphaproteobacteria bacterium]
MTLEERYNQVKKARATFMNALAIGAIIASGLSALNDGRFLAAVVFVIAGIILHLFAQRVLEQLRVGHVE